MQSSEGLRDYMTDEKEQYEKDNPGGVFHKRKGYLEGSRMFCMFDEIATVIRKCAPGGHKESAIVDQFILEMSNRRAGSEIRASGIILTIQS